MTFEDQFPTYSVVIPTFGRDSVLIAARSAAMQTLLPVEILITAHEGTLGTHLHDSLIALPHVRVISVSPGNAASTRNRGINETTGSYIAFLDDDDEWMPNKMQTQFSKSRAHVISCRANYVGWSNGNRPIKIYSKNFLLSVYPSKFPISRRIIIPTSSLVIESELARKIPFDESLSEREELWLVHQLESQGYRISQIEDVLITFKSRMPLKVRKISVESDLDWFSRLEKFHRGLGWNFLLGVALRNRVLSRDFLGSWRLLFVAFLQSFRYHSKHSN
jgi:glycosyltransferase involved in cell wall biosynthesis